jgi:hypothetical protein
MAEYVAADRPAQVFDYPGSGHLFADLSKPDEYQPAEADLMWSRVSEFLAWDRSLAAAVTEEGNPPREEAPCAPSHMPFRISAAVTARLRSPRR